MAIHQAPDAGTGNPLRLGIQMIARDGWLGGVNYVVNLFKAVHALPTPLRPQLYLVIPDRLFQDRYVQLHQEALPLASGVLYLGPNVREVRRNNPWITAVADEDQLFEHIDVFYPVHADAFPGKPAASWIPDFQERYYPDFFTEEERERRAAQNELIAAQAPMIVFSSRSAADDFSRFYPDSRARREILHFCSTPDPAVYGGDPEQARARYALPERYLICCNQFWMHKGHLSLFRAMGRLRREGIRFPLVCTGKTEDYRNETFFHTVKAVIQEEGIGDQLHILGVIDKQDQLQLIRGALAVVQPSLFEGWSTIVQEARALGKTIILSDFTVHVEQQPEHAVYFKAGSVEDLAATLRDTLPELERPWDAAREEQARFVTQKAVKAFGLEFLRIASQLSGAFASTRQEPPQDPA